MQSIFGQDDLAAIEAAIWQLLLQAPTSSKVPFHYAVVANIQEGLPQVRTVILRHTDEQQKKISFHTDNRSNKFAALVKDPAISWLFYNEALKLQLRIAASASLHKNDAIANEAWLHSRSSSLMGYTCVNAPGTKINSPIALNVNIKDPSVEDMLFARQNFATVETIVHKIDYCFLQHQGNRRAIFDYTNNIFYWVQA